MELAQNWLFLSPSFWNMPKSTAT